MIGVYHRFEVYDTLDTLRAHTPPELADAVAQTLNGEGDTLLDI